ncbi:MAG: hypothetical protein HY280_00530 [Nitrospinae bacterium]|nr:hypothetical protein [Nitrospinota bacterium]
MKIAKLSDLFLAAGLLFTAGCSYAPYPDGEPKNYVECMEKSTKNFTSSEMDRERVVTLTEKACTEKFPHQ